MQKKIGNTNLIVIKAVYQQSQTSLIREERCEAVTLMEIKNTETGETGLLYHELATDKRDIDEENVWTSNPALFETEHPEGYEIQELSFCGDDTTPSERTDEVTDLIASCCENNQLVYRAGKPDAVGYDEQRWGFYPG